MAFLCTLIAYDFQWVFTILKKREHKMKWMLLTQEPTFFVFMVVTQEPTIRKCKLLLNVSHISWKHLRHHYVKPKFNMPNVLKRYPCMVAWGHATSSVGEDVGTQKCHIFIHLFLHYSLHFIIPLTFYHIIFINTFGFHLLIFHFIHFCITSEFMIKY